MDTENPFKSIKIYNNTVIDSILGNYIIAQPEEFTNGYIYNNSSILYDRIDAIHGGHGATFPHANWTIDNNHFWTTGGSPTVDDGWTTNYITTDPKLPGEPSIDWDGQSGTTYYKDIKFNDIYPSADSPLINAGKTLDAGYNNIFLTEGTDFGALPDEAAFKTASQTGHGNWEIGAFVYTGVTQSSIDQTGWELLYVDSEEMGDVDRPATDSFDGDPDTFWHTEWSLTDPDPCHPHEIQIDLGGFYDICGFRYLPRQDDGPGDENGMIKDYEFYVSSDAADWGNAVASGTWTIGKMEKQVSFDCKLGKYVRLVALSEVEDRPWTTMAELNILAVQPDSDINNDGKVNLEDFAVLSVWWDDDGGCVEPDWCEGADFDMSGTVNMLDLAYFARNWLR
jgi:F5/8 type C domain-containing protein